MEPLAQFVGIFLPSCPFGSVVGDGLPHSNDVGIHMPHLAFFGTLFEVWWFLPPVLCQGTYSQSEKMKVLLLSKPQAMISFAFSMV